MTSYSKKNSKWRPGQRNDRPDICYPEVTTIDHYRSSSSPLGCTDNGCCAPKTPGYLDPSNEFLMVEELSGMEERFRKTLLKYFSQIDREKEGLTDDLRKIKEDFFRYEEDKLKCRNENHHKDKVIRKLTDNAKLFVGEIERLKEELRQHKCENMQIISENNELSKKLDYETETIPHLENELRCLAEENQYLKLLSDDTKLMKQKDSEIRSYVHQCEHLQSTCQQYYNDLHQQTHAINNLSNVNGQLNAEIERLNTQQGAVKEEFDSEKEAIQAELSRVTCEKERYAEQVRELENMYSGLSCAQQRASEWEPRYRAEHVKVCERDEYIRHIETLLRETKLNANKALDEKHQEIRQLYEESSNLKLEMDGAKNEGRLCRVQNDALHIEKNKLKVELERLKADTREMKVFVDEANEKEMAANRCAKEKEIEANFNSQTTQQYQIEAASLKTILEHSQDVAHKLQLKVEQQSERESKLEEEILTFVRDKCSMEQDYEKQKKFAEVLRRQCEACEEQKASKQKELQECCVRVGELETKFTEKEEELEQAHRELKGLEGRLVSVENQRNRLQKDILVQRERLCEEQKQKVDDDINRLSTMNEKLTDELDCLQSSMRLMENDLIEKASVIEQLTNNNALAAKRYDVVKESVRNHEHQASVNASQFQKEIESKERLVREVQDSKELCVNELECIVQTTEKKAKELQSKLEKVHTERKEEVEHKEVLLSELRDELARKEELIVELRNHGALKEDLVETLQLSLDKQERLVNELRNKLASKDLSVGELESRVNENATGHLSAHDTVAAQQKQIEHLQSRLDRYNTTSEDCYGEFTSDGVDLPNAFQFSGSAYLLNDVDVENSELCNDLSNSFGKKASDNFTGNISFDTLHSETKSNKNLIISNLSYKNQVLRSRVRSLQSELEKQSKGEAPILSNEEFNEILEVIDNKNNQIEQLKEQASKDEVVTEFFEGSAETMERKIPRELKLPQPDSLTSSQNSARQGRPRNRTTSLTGPVPSLTAHLNHSYSESPTLRGQEDDRRGFDDGDLRTRLTRMSSEQLKKENEILKLKEELDYYKQKQERTEESYRKLVAQNESMEGEILENRRKIREVQAKRESSEMNESHYKRELHKLNNSAEQLGVQCTSLAKKRQELEMRVNSQERTQFELKENLTHSHREVEHWMHNADSLQNECQELSLSNERFVSQLRIQTDEMRSLEERLKDANLERDVLEQKSSEVEKLYGDVVAENKELRENLFAKMKDNSSLQNNFSEAQQTCDTVKQQLADTEEKTKSFETLLVELRKEVTSLKSEKLKLSRKLEDHGLMQRELLTEKDDAHKSAKHLQKKIEELNSDVSKKSTVIKKQKEKSAEISDQLSHLNEQLKLKTRELKQTTQSLEHELLNVKRLEKLSEDMNKENRKLMEEGVKMKEKLKNVGSECEFYKNQIVKLEREQENLDNVIAKTQQSNSELLESSKQSEEQVRVTGNKLGQLESNLQEEMTEKRAIERKLAACENENAELVSELQQSRHSMNEVESILDQGQQDFDEIEAQLQMCREENIQLDEKLHEAMKDQVRWKCECEELKKKLTEQSDDMEKDRQRYTDDVQKHRRAVEKQQDMERQFHECRTREEYFEERLKGLELVIKSKEEAMSVEKRDKEGLQEEIMNLQRKLIDSTMTGDQMRLEYEQNHNNFIEMKLKLESSQVQLKNLQSENCVLSEKLKEHMESTSEKDAKHIRCKMERDELEFKYGAILKHVSTVENQLEEEQVVRNIEKQELITELSTVKREKDLDGSNSGKKEKDLQAEVERLVEIIAMMEEDRKTEATSSGEWKDKTVIEEEVMKLRDTIEFLEQSRKNDLSIIREKDDENDDLRRSVDSVKMEVESLNYENTHLNSVVEAAEENVEQLSKENSAVKELLSQLEVHQSSLEKENMKVLEELKGKEEAYIGLEKEKKLSDLDNQKFLSENEKLSAELQLMSIQLKNFDEMRVENESLKYDLEAILDERLGMQNQMNELSHIRADNFNLRAKAERVVEMTYEVQNLREELRLAETKYRDTVESYSRENSNLRRQLDDLMKKGASRVPPNRATIPNVFIEQRSFSDVTNEPFTPLKNGVSASTPTQEDYRAAVTSNESRQGQLQLPEKKADVSWSEKPKENLTLNIRSNPFLQRDKSRSSGRLTRVRSPKSQPADLSKAASEFDMRPLSADVFPPPPPSKSPVKTHLGIGNQFVNRLKANFENV